MASCIMTLKGLLARVDLFASERAGVQRAVTQ